METYFPECQEWWDKAVKLIWEDEEAEEQKKEEETTADSKFLLPLELSSLLRHAGFWGLELELEFLLSEDSENEEFQEPTDSESEAATDEEEADEEEDEE